MTDSRLRRQFAAAIRDCPARYPDDIADAVLRVRDQRMEQLAAALRDVLAEFDPVRDVTPTGTGEPVAYRCPQIPAWQYRQWQALAGPPAAHDCPASTTGPCVAAAQGGDVCAVQDGECAHDDGPSVAECAADDRAHWDNKHAGDGP